LKVNRRFAKKASDAECICAVPHIEQIYVLLMVSKDATLRSERPVRMDDNTEAICQWNLCEANAEKHVRFGFQIFQGLDGPCGNAYTTMPDHYDLCEPHTEESRVHYLQIAVDELGVCPSQCREQVEVPEHLTSAVNSAANW
jgi:hypothetical protein